MTWTELHTLARDTIAKAISWEDVKPEAVQYALEILRIGMLTSKALKEQANG